MAFQACRRPLILLWQGGTALALFTVIMLVLRERGLKLSPAMWLLGLLLLGCTPANEPVHGTLFFGQINIFLMLLVALDILPRKRALPGIGIGLAAGMKLTPAYMGLVLLFQKRWWQAIIAILTFAVTVAIGFVTIPDAADFWTDAIFKSSRVGEHTNPGAQSIRSVMVRAWGIDGGWIWLAAVVVVFILTCLALRTAMKHRNNSAALALAGISSCLVSPSLGTTTGCGRCRWPSSCWLPSTRAWVSACPASLARRSLASCRCSLCVR